MRFNGQKGPALAVYSGWACIPSQNIQRRRGIHLAINPKVRGGTPRAS